MKAEGNAVLCYFWCTFLSLRAISIGFTSFLLVRRKENKQTTQFWQTLSRGDLWSERGGAGSFPNAIGHNAEAS